MANLYYDSLGKSYTDQQIKKEWTQAKKGFMVKYVCECCNINQTNDPDHTIPKATCKVLHKVDLIFLQGNISWSCRDCHNEWESYKSGKFSHHKNAYTRMIFVAIYDTETFIKRYYCITNESLKERLTPLFEEITS
jgi:hypothetical protein